MGAKPKPVIDYAEVERLAGLGLTHDEICHCLGIARATLYRYKKLDKDFRDAITRGTSRGMYIATNALQERVKEGDVSAIKYYLNNRGKGDWRDRHELEHSGSMEHTITVVDPGCGYVGPDKATDD